MSKDDFFVGYADTPKTDRRFFLGAGLALMAGTGALAWGIARYQNNPGQGSWDQGAVRDWTGIVTAEPYSMLRTADLDGTPRTVLLSCLGKCGVAARIGSLAGQAVTVRGSLIQRGENAMIAVVDGPDWIRATPELSLPETLAFPEKEPITDVSLTGEILDSKCWFGAMRPSEGKAHKSCAALCIRGGLPPAFFASDGRGRSLLMIMTDNGMGHGLDILPFVADPLRVTGTLYKWGNLLLLDAPVQSFSRPSWSRPSWLPDHRG